MASFEYKEYDIYSQKALKGANLPNAHGGISVCSVFAFHFGLV